MLVMPFRAIATGSLPGARRGEFGYFSAHGINLWEAQVIANGMNQSADDVRGAVEDILEKATLQWEVERLREQVLRGQLERRHSEYDRVFENSPRMKAIKGMIDQVADTDATVLVLGESGVGKELVSRAIQTLFGQDDAPRDGSGARPDDR